MERNDYTRDQLLEVLESYHGMITRNYKLYGNKYDRAILSDLESSLRFVLKKNGINVNKYGKEV